MKKIAIIGGGLVGLTQAIALARAGLDVAVVDNEDPQDMLKVEFDGRVSAIAWRSYRLLKSLDVWEHIAPHAEAILDIRVSEFGSKLFLHFDHEEIGDEPFGYIVENRYIRAALYQAARKYNNLELIAPAKVKNIDIDDCRIEIEQEGSFTNLYYSLLIGADGKNSQVRRTAGIKELRTSYKHYAIVCTIEHSKPHMGLAHEHFMNVGPFAVLPMQGNRSSLVWTEAPEVARLMMKMNETDFLEQIEKRVKHLGDIKVLKGRWCYPLELMHAHEYSAKNLVLIGDAAHAIHPIAGQGVNLGFRDVEVLTEKIIERAKLGLGFSSAGSLSEYESLRRIDNSLMIAATHALTHLFSNKIFPLKLARTLGLGAVNQIPPLRRIFMKYASGKPL